MDDRFFDVEQSNFSAFVPDEGQEYPLADDIAVSKDFQEKKLETKLEKKCLERL